MVVKFDDEDIMRKALWQMNRSLNILSYKRIYRVNYDNLTVTTIKNSVAEILIENGGELVRREHESK